MQTVFLVQSFDDIDGWEETLGVFTTEEKAITVAKAKAERFVLLRIRPIGLDTCAPCDLPDLFVDSDGVQRDE